MAEPTAVVTQSLLIGECNNSSHCPVCPYSTTGIIITGFPLKTIQNLPTAVVGSIVLADCGHIGIMTTGSLLVTVGSTGQCKVGSVSSGDFCGVVVNGVSNHITG